MLPFVEAMEQAVEQRNWYAALALALTIPDMSARAEKGAKPNGKDYAVWFDRWVAPRYTSSETTIDTEIQAKFEARRAAATTLREHFAARRWFILQNAVGKREAGFLCGDDAYALRCAYLHSGSDDITDQRARKILERFLLTAPRGRSFLHNNKFGEGLLQIRVDQYCCDVAKGVRDWLAAAGPEVRSRAEINAKIA